MNKQKMPAANDRVAAKRRGRIGIYVFLSIFFIAGTGVFIFSSVVPAIRWLEAQGWQSVPVTIESLKLNAHRGDDSTTYSVSARYSYQWLGQSFHSEGVSLYSGSDNVGSFWQDLEGRLRYERRRGQSHAWVNPDNPGESVLDRSYRFGQFMFGLLFMVMFCGIAGLILWATVRAAKSSEAMDNILDGSSAAEGISSGNLTGYQILAGMGAVFAGSGVVIGTLAIPEEMAKGNSAVLAVLIFPATGALMLTIGLRNIRRWKRIGKTLFFPDPAPGYAGGQVGGSFQLNNGRFMRTPRFRLQCVHVYQSGSGKDRTTRRQVLLQQEMPALQQQDGSIRALFDVPAEHPGSGRQPGYRGSIQWLLSCEGILQMADGDQLSFERQWTLPVVQGQGEASQPLSEQEREQRQRVRREEADSSALEQINQQQGADFLRLESEQGRHLTAGLVPVLFGVIFGGSGMFLFHQAAQEGGMLWFMAAIFSLVGFAVLAMGIFWLGRGLEAEIRPGSATAIRSMFGMRLYRRTVALNNAAQLSVAQSLTATGTDGVQKEYFRIVAQADGKKVTLAEGILGKDVAESLRQRIVDTLTAALDDELN